MRLRRTDGSILPVAAAALGLALAGPAWADRHEGSERAPRGAAERTGEGPLVAPAMESPLVAKVRRELRKSEGFQDVRVASRREGEVTLEGRVSSTVERQEAARVARRVQGVHRVENRLELGGGADGVSSPPPEEGR